MLICLDEDDPTVYVECQEDRKHGIIKVKHNIQAGHRKSSKKGNVLFERKSKI